MTRRSFVRVALVMVALGAGLMAQPGPVDAATLVKSSWWYKANTADPDTFVPPAAAIPGGLPAAPAPLPATQPTVPEGSVLVEGTPEGATAVAALSWTLSEELAPMLTITPSDSSNVPADAVILACRAAIAWEPPETQPGAWEKKPLVDCGASVQGIPNEDGSIAFGLAPLVSGGTKLEIVLTPGLAQAQPVRIGSSFSLSFDPAAGAVLATQTPGGAGAVVVPPPEAASPSVTAAPTPAYTPPSANAPIAEPSLEPQEQAPALDQQTALPATVPAPAADDDRAQGIGFLVLLAGLAFAGLAYVTPARGEDGTIGLGRFKRPVPATVLATAPTEPINGGLGRFARPRTGPPPALS